jgi:hypothetical protein
VDDLRIGSLGSIDALFGETKDGSKKRSKQKHHEAEEAPEDVVTLHSDGEDEDSPSGYLPAGTEKL